MPGRQEAPSNLKDLRRKFRERFGGDPDFIVRAPGRINLIGEHTDYNRGFVLPMAIDRYITVLASGREDNKVRLFSTSYREMASFNPDLLEATQKSNAWYSYVEGIAWALRQGGYYPKGLNMIIDSTLPPGAGLASSTALEIATGYAFNIAGSLEIKRRALALLAQRGENDYIGSRIGIVDPFIITLGQRDTALLIDCQSLDYQAVPFNLNNLGYSLIVINTGVVHSQLLPEYNRRRMECEEAFIQIRRLSGEEELTSLRDVPIHLFDRVKNLLPEVLRKRARHVLSENWRTVEMVKALKRNDLPLIRELMSASHFSLRDDFAVSVRELDRLVELALAQEGCLAARLTGAGFGGCTINIVHNDTIPQFIEHVFERYKEELHHPTAQYYICRSVNGVDQVN